ncbi:hypothetical protein ACOSQ4_009139 [Xanthoceras sorbifolium]
MSSSSSSITQKKYEVFLSFRGEDTRCNFISHLHAALCDKGIVTFIDDNMNGGNKISESLLKAIKDSMISIIVFSKGYASSSWCLDELVKILECKKMDGQIVVPVSYGIDPSDVRKQSGTFADAFAEHEQRFKERLTIWRDALTEAANISGWDLGEIKYESLLKDRILEDVLKRLSDMSPYDTKGLVGIDSRIEQIESLLSIGSDGLSNKVVKYAGGVPLALKVIGSSLLKKSKEVWESALDKLEKSPNKKIQRVLQISYDGLDDGVQKAFLDIACFFQGWDIDQVKELLCAGGLFAIDDLIDKSLIAVSNNKIMMHDLLQAMGREIVRQESIEDPGKRSRLWHHEEIYQILKENMVSGTHII